MSYFKNCCLSAFLLFVLVPILNAQNQKSSISVTVKNQLGEVIPNAEIIISPLNKEGKTLVTNKQGVAQLSKLSEGDYQINITAKGFNPYQSEVIKLNQNEDKKIEVELEIELIETNVIVGDEQSVDTDKFGATNVITEAQIAKLPDDPKELERMIRSMAGESVTGEAMPITVDGQEGGKIPPKQAIQQVRVNQNVFSAQYENASGGGIEFFTRANVEKFNGFVGFGFADSRFNASDAFIGRKIPMQIRNFYFNFTGPINKRTSFFIFGGRNENDTSTSINAKILNANLQPVEFKETFAASNRDHNIFFNLTSDITKKHKIAVGYSMYLNNAKGQNVGGFSLPSRENNGQNQFYNLRVSDTYLANENVVNQARFALNYSRNRSFGGSNDVAINVLEAFSGGGSQNNSRNQNLSFEIASDTTWQINKYGLGFGWRFRGQMIDQNSTSNFGGTYTFSGRTAPILDANNNPVLDGNGNPVATQIDSLESYRRTLLFRQLGYTSAQIRNLGGGANQFTISGGDPKVSINQYDIALYQQNSYKISETLALSFGLRYENQTNISSNFDFSPRFGVIWSPKPNPKRKNPIYALPRVSAGFGVFFRRFDVNNFLSIRQSSGERSQYLITDPTILDIFPNVSTVSQLQQFALPRSQRFIDDELESTYQNMFSVTASKPLPAGFSAVFTFSRFQAFRQPLTHNINAPLAGTYNPLIQNSGLRPLGNTGNIYETIAEGRSENTRIAVSLRLPEKYISGGITYSFTKAKNDIVGGSGSPNDPYDFRQEYAPAINDGVHRVDGHAFYRLPRKFSLDFFYSIISGSRFNIITGRDTNGDGFFLERPSFATDLTKKGLISTEYGVLDPNPSPTDQLIPRNLGRGFGYFNLDAGLSKSFGWGEDKANKKPPKRTLYMSIRASNLFNHVNRGNPIGNMSSPNFLKTLSTGNSDTTIIINGMRSGNGNRALNFSIGFGF